MLLRLAFLLIISYVAAKPKDDTAVVGKVVNPDGNKEPSTKAEQNGHFQGDMKIAAKSEAGNRNALTDLSKRWPNGQVCYFFDPSATAGIKDNVKKAIADFEAFSCIRFHERKDASEANCIRVFFGQGCYSDVGMVGGVQDLSLEDPGCLDAKGVAIHEFMHALGFSHEQSREDRDNYLTIKWDQIVSGMEHNFDKADIGYSAYGFPYDLNSVMQYDGVSFSKDDVTPTMIPKDPKVTKLGTRLGFTDIDLKKLNKVYCDTSNTTAGKFLKFEDISAYKTSLVDMMNAQRTAMKASDMYKLTWDDAMATAAQTVAKDCTDLDGQQNANGLSNIRFAHSTSYTDMAQAFVPVINNYKTALSSLATSGPGCKDDFGWSYSRCPAKYTMIVNGAASKVGCAISRCQGLKGNTKAANAEYVQGVCVFNAPMSPNANPPFTVGTACSNFVGGTCQNGLNVNGKLCIDGDGTSYCEGNIAANPGMSKAAVCDYMIKNWGSKCDKTCGKC